MLGSRIQNVVREIDTARCVGRWHSINALAARYAKHHSTGEQGKFHTNIIRTLSAKC